MRASAKFLWLHRCVWEGNGQPFHCVASCDKTTKLPPTPTLTHTLAPLFALFLSTHCSSTPSHKSLDKWAAHRCCRSAPPLLPAASDLYSMGMGAMCLLFTAACVNVNLTLLRPPQLSRTLCHSTSENPLALAQGLCTEIVCWELESRSLEVKIT